MNSISVYNKAVLDVYRRAIALNPKPEALNPMPFKRGGVKKQTKTEALNPKP